jgi:hypothetical protein
MCATHGAAAALNDSNPDSIRSQVTVAVRAAVSAGPLPSLGVCGATTYSDRTGVRIQVLRRREAVRVISWLERYRPGGCRSTSASPGGVKAYVMYHVIGGVFLC